MKYNTIQKTGFKISEVSFGCMSLKSDAIDNNTIIHNAIEGGINLFDTADLYEKGQNEILLGKALKDRRNNVFISTKVGNRWKEDGSGWEWCPRKEYILKAIDESLKRLQTDYIDMYLLHGGTMEDPIDETVEAFERLVDMGKIRSYGLSSIRPNVIREYSNRSNIAAVMTQYSYLDRRPEEETLDLLHHNNVGVLARGSMASGLLIDKPAKDYLDLKASEVENIVNVLKQHLPEDKTIQDTVMKYVTGHQAVTTAVAGIRTIPQLEDALQASNVTGLSASDIEQLRSLWKGNHYNEHR
ncbi:aldo/keto reductase [Flavobacterium sp. DG1-102-2]|uniref:aldo/keto reductase n=1 Tax=Flavobacterium sp. DG1-102-2 TaxID=3081663 RepID=UPI00294A746E|nr:aldo/keto reductase [Flavobacterium sp. DG1-102-2]MDV6167423.1 aldo/keto reductase [Flavobacterium sp. DG1-102-2]